ncbi:MAG: c-type cytochrome [Acidobacteria bacterium]|nr:c-type cytochrome [Acidobacteriota bacterium]
MIRSTRRSVRSFASFVIFFGVLGIFLGAVLAQSQTRPAAKAAAIPTPPPAFDDMPNPADNPPTAEKIELGRQLFFDKRLSADATRSCYSCHVCEKGLTDGLPTAVGALGKKLTRSSPTLWNIGYHKEYYWDGRAASLEKQGLAAWTGGNMGADPNQIVPALNAIPGYKAQFQKVFSTDVTADGMMKAISSFERTLFCGTTRFDRSQQGDAKALGDAAKRGWEIFRGKGGCGTCHAGILFTDMQYHNAGVGMDKPEPDIGRKKVTNADADLGAFKTPTLRDISKSAPYFHDGSVATLAEAVDVMAAGGKPNPHLDTKNLQDRKLTADEKKDLIAFLESLDCECTLSEPNLP